MEWCVGPRRARRALCRRLVRVGARLRPVPLLGAPRVPRLDRALLARAQDASPAPQPVAADHVRPLRARRVGEQHAARAGCLRRPRARRLADPRRGGAAAALRLQGLRRGRRARGRRRPAALLPAVHVAARGHPVRQPHTGRVRGDRRAHARARLAPRRAALQLLQALPRVGRRVWHLRMARRPLPVSLVTTPLKEMTERAR
mmetsp:Transcript_5946/g.15566  ORF Transcript_5946/g.15566 Transcript_5946/m.15566 type:complete len:202 (+) Transcript_5946:475-1080(+)